MQSNFLRGHDDNDVWVIREMHDVNSFPPCVPIELQALWPFDLAVASPATEEEARKDLRAQIAFLREKSIIGLRSATVTPALSMSIDNSENHLVNLSQLAFLRDSLLQQWYIQVNSTFFRPRFFLSAARAPVR
eukprot:GEMP01119877.1.p1 GENE.GEMP01119877.1~~GEMP01119877.1.p1  ORF type:complete len:133 (+),score=26.45 GEMP01119877.1:71-469(+)